MSPAPQTSKQLGNLGIPLSEAPERFFDPALWGEYISPHTNREEALTYFASPDPALLTFHREEAAKLPWQYPATQHAIRRGRIKEFLVARFREQLIEGKLVASGFSSLAVERVTIPAERWHDLWPNFVANKADGDGVSFTSVRILEANENPGAGRPPFETLHRVVNEAQSKRGEPEEEAT